MRPTHPRHKAWAGAGAFLTLLAIGLCAPSSSRADCRHPGDRPAIGIGIDALRPDGPPGDSKSVPPPKPCDGPQCSGKSAPPMTPAAPKIPPRAESWGLAIEPTPIADPGSASLRPEDAPARPVRPATSIFHPPRLPR